MQQQNKCPKCDSVEVDHGFPLDGDSFKLVNYCLECEHIWPG